MGGGLRLPYVYVEGGGDVKYINYSFDMKPNL